MSNLELLRALDDGSYTGVEVDGEHFVPYIITAESKSLMTMKNVFELPEEELPR